MKYRHFTNADTDVSLISIGTWAMGGERYGEFSRQESIDSIRAMIDRGVNLIDTAPAYGNGYAEQLVAEALRDGYRDKVMISTKFGLSSGTHLNPFRRDASFNAIMREVNSSLRNLHTDHLDFYFVHWPDPNTPIAETMAALNLLKQDGTIRFIGLSNFSIEQVQEAMKYGKVDVIQPLYCMVDRRNVKLMKWAREKGIDSMTYGSLASGALSGAYRTMPQFAGDDIRNFFYDYFKEPKFSKIQQLLKVMDVIAEEKGVDVSKVALNYTATRNYVGTCLVGATKVRHAINNAEAFDFDLSDDDIRKIDEELVRLQLMEEGED